MSKVETYVDFEAVQSFDESYVEIIKSVVEKTAELEGFTASSEVCITITDETEIKRLNKEYRGIDKVTDVLSFPLSEKPLLEDGYIALGDIIICLKRAQEQAEEYSHSFERELAFLTVHGMLHLFGYDHMQSADEEIMLKKQEVVLNSLGILR